MNRKIVMGVPGLWDGADDAQSKTIQKKTFQILSANIRG